MEAPAPVPGAGYAQLRCFEIFDLATDGDRPATLHRGLVALATDPAVPTVLAAIGDDSDAAVIGTHVIHLLHCPATPAVEPPR